MSYLTRSARRGTPQSEPLPGAGQVDNRAGGFAWEVDDWTRLRRFLILGTEGGSYHAAQTALTRERAQAVERCVLADGVRVVAEIVRVSRAGHCPGNEPAVFALAMAAGLGDEETRRAALGALSLVCRTGTHVLAFATHVEQFRGWGRSLRRGVGRWYAAQEPDALAYQAVRHRQRDGVTHRDLLRLSHPAASVSAGNPTSAVSDEQARLFEWIVRGGDTAGLPAITHGFARAQAATRPSQTAAIVREYRLPREALRSEHLASLDVWEALLEDLPMTALVRNLATMTRIGLLVPGTRATARVVARLRDAGLVRRARVHPLALLAALRSYQAGGVAAGQGWNPVTQIVDALHGAFYDAFACVQPTGGRVLLALDVSGSMGAGAVAGVPGLTPREASAALALVTAATEPHHEVVGFFAARGGWQAGRRPGEAAISPLAISSRQRLDDVVRALRGLAYGATDCALPMRYAQAQEREVDTFVIYTDSATWVGDVHPAQALADYRRASGIDARLVVVGMLSNGFSIADPADPGMLDVVGFDTATPQLIADFARGTL